MKRSDSAPGDRLVRGLVLGGFVAMIWMALARINIGPLGSVASGERQSEVIRDAGDAVPSLTIDINRASAAQMQLFPGIGPALSERIVADREAHGPFKSIDDLKRVRGIGEKTVERIRSLASVTIETEGQSVERLAQTTQP